MILKFIPEEKIYGILGNHDEYGLLESRNIRNIHSHHHINTELQLKNGTNVIGVYRCALIKIPNLQKNIIYKYMINIFIKDITNNT